MIEVRPFQSSDFTELPRDRLPVSAWEFWTPQYVGALIAHGPAFTLRVGERIMIIAGVAFDVRGAGWLWSFLANDSGPYMLAITRAVRRALGTFPGKIFATSVKAFAASHRWLKLVGLSLSVDPRWPPGPDLLFERA